MQQFSRLETYLTIREGFVTGADNIFLVSRDAIPQGEEAIYKPFLSDREMERYAVPSGTSRVVFYPYVEGVKVDTDRLQSDFPQTWRFLESHQSTLTERPAVRRGQIPWWCPERPRSPDHMFRPKLVSPHLIVAPKFSLDSAGRYAVSHSPFMYPEESGAELDFLRYFLALLNSSVGYWQIVHSSHRYRRGYAMLERKTLRGVRVPDPSTVRMATMKKLQGYVRQLMEEPENGELDRKLDGLAAEVFGLTKSERAEVGMDD